MPKLSRNIIIAIIIGLTALLFLYLPDASSPQDKYRVIYYLLIIAMVGSSVVVRFRNNISGSLKQGLIWVAAFMGLVLLYSFRNDLAVIKGRIIAELAPSRAKVTQEGTIEFRASDDGHFHINTLVNGTSIRFMLDTGATDVVLPPRIAKKIGIDLETLRYDQVYRTANGQGMGARIKINTIQIGDFRFHDISASVNAVDMDTPLLGMSFLNKLSGYEVNGDTLILKP